MRVLAHVHDADCRQVARLGFGIGVFVSGVLESREKGNGSRQVCAQDPQPPLVVFTRLRLFLHVLDAGRGKVGVRVQAEQNAITPLLSELSQAFGKENFCDLWIRRCLGLIRRDERWTSAAEIPEFGIGTQLSSLPAPPDPPGSELSARSSRSGKSLPRSHRGRGDRALTSKNPARQAIPCCDATNRRARSRSPHRKCGPRIGVDRRPWAPI